MARYDKYEPMSGGTRARLAVAWSGTDLNKVWAVGLDANGRIVKGGGNTGIIGVLVLSKAKSAGAVVDVMQDGDIVEMNVGHAGIVAGTNYYGDAATGALSAVAPAAGVNAVRVGFTVEATRLVVRTDRLQG